MGSSGESVGVVEAGPGSIVWVRRRNGSWWPGKILGPEDLSASHIMSPRSGTPVKLLGREDASVDWYNLEKSKRVKAFRCGEFDDCIERAAASVGLPAKKREKYARREDAILHALELEKKFLEKKYGKFGRPNTVRENSLETEKKMLLTPVRALQNGNGNLGNHELWQPHKKVDKSVAVETNSIPLHALKSEDAIYSSLPEQSTVMSSQIRRLYDFGHRAVPLNRIFCSAASEDINRPAIDGHAYAIPVRDSRLETSSDSDSRHSIDKGKRFLEGYVEESLSKRHHALHPFVNVRHNNAELADHALRPDMFANGLLGDGFNCSVFMPSESSEMFNMKRGLQVPMGMPISRHEMANRRPQHGNSVEESTSGSSEETESDSSETQSVETHVDAGMLVSDAETRIRTQQTLSRRTGMHTAHESASSDASDLSPDERSQFHYIDPNASDAGVSKWQLKGKRNVRNMSQRPRDGFSEKTDLDSRGMSLNQRSGNHSLGYYHGNGYINDGDFVEDDYDSQFGKRGCLPFQAASKRQSYVGQNMIDWEELTWGRPFRAFWEETGSYFSPMFIGRNGHDMLIDVDLEVQANRQGEHVPWVSLMSKIDGKAIIGHPVIVEILEEGTSDILLSTDVLTYDSDKGKVPPMWRTARRTATVRVPRPPQLDIDEDTDYQHLHQSGKVQSKKPLTPNSARKGSVLKKNHAHLSRLPQGMKKAPRKGISPPNQKTKTLSSISFDQKATEKPGNDDTSYNTNSVIKPVDSGPPTVACIPVKLVFSRLLEAVGRPPSGSVKGVSVNSNKDQNSS